MACSPIGIPKSHVLTTRRIPRQHTLTNFRFAFDGLLFSGLVPDESAFFPSSRYLRGFKSYGGGNIKKLVITTSSFMLFRMSNFLILKRVRDCLLHRHGATLSPGSSKDFFTQPSAGGSFGLIMLCAFSS